MDHLARIEQAQNSIQDAQTELEQAIKDAHNDGVPIRQLALASGLSRPTIYKMLDK